MTAPSSPTPVFVSIYKASDDVPLTESLKEQEEVEKSCLQLLQPLKTDDYDDFLGEIPLLRKDKHIVWLKKGFERVIYESYLSLDASRTWCLYWLSHSLDLLDSFHDDDTCKQRVINFIKTSYNVREGGFGGGPHQLAHLASNYAAVMCLIICGDEEALEFIDRQKMYDFLMGLKDYETNGFRMHDNGEVDMRGAYLAVSVASILCIVTDELFFGLEDYVRKRQTYEGGIAGEIGLEAHGGYTYCGFAALCILGKAHVLDLNCLLSWTAFRQMGIEGGFQGRTNKLVDACYSFWVGAIFVALRELLCQNKEMYPLDHMWFSYKNLQLYLLCCCQSEHGGFKDKPTENPDFYHTCYALSGLSISQRLIRTKYGNEESKRSSFSSDLETIQNDSPHEAGVPDQILRNFKNPLNATCLSSSSVHNTTAAENLLPPVNFLYNVRDCRLMKAREYFKSRPFFEKRKLLLGEEGKGVRELIEHFNSHELLF